MPEEEKEALLEQYRLKCRTFQDLLQSNHRTLEGMAGIEELLQGYRYFGMNQVRSLCTEISSNVYKMIQNLQVISGDGYPLLFDAFESIKQQVTDAVYRQEAASISWDSAYCLKLETLTKDMGHMVGNKMANLGELESRLGFRIQPGFVITASGYRRLMEYNNLESEIARQMQITDSNSLSKIYELSWALRERILTAKVPHDLEQAILKAYADLEEKTHPRVKLAVRSSALGEDEASTTFAGQYETELNVSPEFLLYAFKKVMASKYGVPAMMYRLHRGIPDERVLMSVGCMAMAEGVSGGVLYTRDPFNARDCAVIHAVWGLPSAVVDGSSETDEYLVHPDEQIEQKIVHKTDQIQADPEEGVVRLPVPEPKQDSPCLSSDKALTLAKLGWKTEEHFAAPQDMEWILAPDGDLVVLQTRPLLTMDSEHRAGQEHAPRTDYKVLAQGGETASPGVGAGPIRLVRRDVDLLTFPKGGVLLCRTPQARWASLLGRASAVISEIGGYTGHLANVAREFHVPALFGVPKAVDLLAGADEVTVDADSRIVYAGRAQPLLERADKQKTAPMLGTEVMKILSQVSEHIVPLHLLDPAAQDFVPKSCTTYHDITRFCHEKAVQEMFSLSQAGVLPEHFGKRLVYQGVRMQYWILDLGGGFKRAVSGTKVKLDDIASVPMLALWEGMCAVARQAPVQMDAKGFMSVMLEAGMNPELESGRGSITQRRNYFMISEDFCNLQAQFGFHFCTVETRVSEVPEENYLSFRFKGGAADMDRRHERVRFIADFLEDQDFQVEVRQDLLHARLENVPRDFVLQRLKVVGYMLIHTCQLDMVMHNQSLRLEHRKKMEEDIGALTGEV